MKLMSAGSEWRAAWRALVRSPRFSLLACGLLAIGVAGNAAVFGLHSALFVRPLPFPDPERLVDVDASAPKVGLDRIGVSQADACAWTGRASSFDDLAFSYSVTYGLSARGVARPVSAAQVTHRMASVLGIRPLLGRDILPEEDRPGAPPVVLLGFEAWERDFGRDPGLIGSIVKLDAVPHTVIGVLPPRTVYPPNADVWVALAPDPARTDRYYLKGIGRLARGATQEQARSDLSRVQQALVRERGGTGSAVEPLVGSLQERELGRFRSTTRVLLAAVAVVLLVSCVNLAALLLARGVARSRERAVRAALGASRRALVRQSLAETALLAVAGGGAGALLGHVALAALLRTVPAGLLPGWVEVRADARHALFCALLAIAAALLVGVVPAVQAARARAVDCLAGGRASHARQRHRFLGACVVAEVALAAALLVGAGLLLRAYRSVLRVDPGFRAENLTSFRLLIPDSSYGTPERRLQLLTPLVNELAALPGVRAAGAVSPPPLGSDSGSFFKAEGGWQPANGEPDLVTSHVVATPGYIEAAGLTVSAGRGFRDGDGETAAVAVVSESFARRYWPGLDPLGRRLRYAWADGQWMQVVGVVRDVRHFGLDRPVRETVYLPLRQRPMEPGFSIVLRSDAESQGLAGAIREIVKRADPDLTVLDLRTMSERLDESLWSRRASSWLVWSFAAAAALLALAGVSGVLAYVVAQRTREIGVRMAFGAPAGRVMRDVVAGGLRLTAIGLALGLLGAAGASRLLGSLLFDVKPQDPATYAVVAVAVTVACLAAATMVARRAASLDPAQALRCE